MKRLEVRFTSAPGRWRKVGTLAEDRGRVFFEYDPGFLATGLDLSPFRLPFRPGLFEHGDRAFGPLPGVFDDSLPDGWGLLLMDRHFRTLGLSVAQVGPLDRLSWLGARTMGALTYHPPATREGVDDGVFDLHELGRQSREILEGRSEEVLPQLLRAGGSPGGARPKVLVGFDPSSGVLMSGADDLPAGFDAWMVKFPARRDRFDSGPVEFAYARMAVAAGIDMPAARIFRTAEGDGFFGVRRFDRDANRRFHVHTFGNLIQADFRIPSGDYADLLKAVSILTRNHEDVLRAYRRAAFNVFGHNRDDHVKNFAFRMDEADGSWSITPAYDLIFAEGPGGEHTLTVAGEGRHPGRDSLLRLARQAGIAERQAIRILDEVRAATDMWAGFASEAGVDDDVRDFIAARLSAV
jgi:serine/threonine-protein kinase HipA